jgi:pimeloyl-ACP methyl ester carboxylesterase
MCAIGNRRIARVGQSVLSRHLRVTFARQTGAVPERRLILIHGAATTARVWRHTVALLPEFKICCPERRCSGDLEVELAALAPACAGAIVAGVSGGATLGLELAARGVPIAAAALHEPAAGSLAPGLLDGVVAAYRTGGVAAFGQALYGDAWSLAEAPADTDAVRRDLTMFRAFEPSPVTTGRTVVVSVGANSPPPRHEAAHAMRRALGVEVTVLPGAGHAVHLAAPERFAALIRTVAAGVETR